MNNQQQDSSLGEVKSSLSSQYVLLDLCLRVVSHEIPPFLFSMSNDIVIVLVLLVHPFLRDTHQRPFLILVLSSLPKCSLIYHCRSYNIDVLIEDELSTSWWSLHCTQFWFSLMVFILCKEKIMWWGVVTIIIYKYKNII